MRDSRKSTLNEVEEVLCDLFTSNILYIQGLYDVYTWCLASLIQASQINSCAHLPEIFETISGEFVILYSG